MGAPSAEKERRNIEHWKQGKQRMTTRTRGAYRTKTVATPKLRGEKVGETRQCSFLNSRARNQAAERGSSIADRRRRRRKRVRPRALTQRLDSILGRATRRAQGPTRRHASDTESLPLRPLGTITRAFSEIRRDYTRCRPCFIDACVRPLCLLSLQCS